MWVNEKVRETGEVVSLMGARVENERGVKEDGVVNPTQVGRQQGTNDNVKEGWVSSTHNTPSGLAEVGAGGREISESLGDEVITVNKGEGEYTHENEEIRGEGDSTLSNMPQGGGEQHNPHMVFSLGCSSKVWKKYKKVGRKGTKVKANNIKGGGEANRLAKQVISSLSPPPNMIEEGLLGGKRKFRADEDDGFDGDDVAMHDVYDAGKKLRISSEVDGVPKPLTVAEVGCDQPRKDQ